MVDKDYSEILEGNVDEVKDAIRDASDLDLEELLSEEEDGDDRKTVKEFIQSRIDSSEEEEEETAEESEDQEEEEEPELADEEIAREIEEETAGGLFGSFSREMLFAAGIGLGLLIGLAVGMGTGAFGTGGATPASVQEKVSTLYGTNSQQGDVSVSQPELRSGMYYMNVTVTQQVNGTSQSSTQPVFVTTDGQLMFPEVRSALFQSPINIDQTIAQLQAGQNQQGQTGDSQPDSGNQTDSGSSGNQTQ